MSCPIDDCHRDAAWLTPSSEARKAVRGFSPEKAVAATDGQGSSVRLQMPGEEVRGPAVGQGGRFGVVGDAAVPRKRMATIRVAVDLHLRACVQRRGDFASRIGGDVFVFL